MSVVTEIMICSRCIPKEYLKRINNWLNAHNQPSGLKFIHSYAGGTKKMESDILAGAFDLFVTKDFIAFLKTVYIAEDTDIYIMEQEETRFHIIRLK